LNRQPIDNCTPNYPTGVSPRLQFSLRDLLLVTAVIALHLAACVIILRGLSTRDILELARLAIAAFAGTILALKVGPRWVSRRAGRVVALLRHETPRFTSLAWVCWLPLVIIVFDPLIKKLLAWEAPLVILRGLLILWMIQNAGFAVNSFARRSWALCDRGLVRDGIFFVRWRKSLRNTWSIDAEGNLRASVSRWRVMAPIPPRQREAVEALLKEKLGTNVGLEISDS